MADEAVESLARSMHGRRVAVLTGAGCSTESGIPDYRGPETRRRARNPVQFRAFSKSGEARRRYWARALVGYRRFSSVAPNPAHFALARLERAGLFTGLLTQNVDRLHHRAGSRNVVELHGAIAEVICLECRHIVPRDAVQAELEARNPGWTRISAEMAPDGDAELEDVRGFRLVDCERCGGVLKPHVVFFGEGVPKERVERAWSIVDAADLLLVVGSSLAVYSGYRFVRGAARRGQPVVILGLGPTRGDELASSKLEGKAGALLPALSDALLGTHTGRVAD